MQLLYETQSFVAASDVTRQLHEVNADANLSAAVSMETNEQPNGQQQQQKRIYTSTPKNVRKSAQRHNDAIGFCNLAKATTKHYVCVGGVKGYEVTFDVRLKALIFLFGIIIISHRVIMIAMPYINGSSVQELSGYVQAQLSAALDLSEQHQLRSKVSPVVCGVIVACFFYTIVYLDSDLPGVNPPALFSPRSKQRYRQRSSALQLNYLCALAAGLVVTILMFTDF